jgi:hypothetical protein
MLAKRIIIKIILHIDNFVIMKKKQYNQNLGQYF